MLYNTKYMDNQSYLDQIAAKPQKGPAASSGNSFLSPKMIKIALVGIVAAIFIITLGSMFGAKGAKGKALAEALNIRFGNLSKIIKDYNTYVKSPELRSMAVTLQSSMESTAKDISPVLSSDFGIDPKKATAKVSNDETNRSNNLSNTLTDARLNGILDRVYANTLTSEIGDLIYLESDLYSKTTSQAMKDLLTTSSAALNNLHDKFFDFSNSY